MTTATQLSKLDSRLRSAGVRSLGLTKAPEATPAQVLGSAIAVLTDYLDGKCIPVQFVDSVPAPVPA